MKQQSKLNSQQQAEESARALSEHTQQTSAQEFATPEEMLRHDALHTPVPPTIAFRLQQSIGSLTPPPRSWWRRFFGPSNP